MMCSLSIPARWRVRRLMRLVALLGAVLFPTVLVTSVARAQSPTAPPVLSGSVQDELGRPIEDADILLYQTQMRIRSRRDGTFRFDSLKTGKYTLEVRHLGYKPVSQKVSLKEQGTTITIKMERVPFFLPSVLTTAERGGLSGVVADTAYAPLNKVRVNVLGSGQSVETDSAGAFFLPVKPGHYMVELKRDGYARQLVGVTVPEQTGRKLAAWMVPAKGNDPMEGAMLFDLPMRMAVANPLYDRFYTREDLESNGIRDLRQLGSTQSRRLMNPDCPIYVNGNLKREVPLWSLRTEDIEFVEVFEEPPGKNFVSPNAEGSAAKMAAGKRQMSRQALSVCGVALIAWLRK